MHRVPSLRALLGALLVAPIGGCFLFAEGEADEAEDGACKPDLPANWHRCAGGQSDDCPSDEICALDLEVPCPCGRSDCAVPRRCLPERNDATKGPLFGCADDTECRSGRCVEDKCEAPCDPDSRDATHCGELVCRAESLGGRTGHFCRSDGAGGGTGGAGGGGGGGPGALCHADRDCPRGQLCRINDADGLDDPSLPGARSSCVPRPAQDDAGTPCDGGATDAERNALCPVRGFCLESCEDNLVLACDLQTCAQPCTTPADCPFRFECGADDRWNLREGTEALRVCQLHDVTDVGWGCFDDADCCVFGDGIDWRQEDGGLCCTATGAPGERVCTAPPVRTHCGIQQHTGAPTPHVVSRCRFADGLSTDLPGAPCDGPETCLTGVCAPDGTGGGVCAQLCSLGDEPVARRPSAATALPDVCDPRGDAPGRTCVLQVVRGLGFPTPLCLPVCGFPDAAPACADPGAPAP